MTETTLSGQFPARPDIEVKRTAINRLHSAGFDALGFYCWMLANMDPIDEKGILGYIDVHDLKYGLGIPPDYIEKQITHLLQAGLIEWGKRLPPKSHPPMTLDCWFIVEVPDGDL